MTEPLRAITLTWDPDDMTQIDCALGPGVSVAEAHHVLGAAVDDIECLCPSARISRGGLDLAPPTVELGVTDEDDE